VALLVDNHLRVIGVNIITQITLVSVHSTCGVCVRVEARQFVVSDLQALNRLVSLYA